MFNFIKKSIRGGLSQCSQHYAVANNKYIDNYDQNLPSNYLIYLDANNLYGWAMEKYLPYDNFVWLQHDDLTETFNVNNISDDSITGYILEVDLEYPQHLHKWHSDFPFCLEHRTNTNKLVATLYNKENYIIHYINLKQALKAGIIFKKIHKVLQFSQRPWLKPYIELNTNLRTQASNNFEKDFYKLMNNAVFGKTLENVDKRVNVRIVTKWECPGRQLDACTLINKPNFERCLIINENLVIIQLKRLKITYNKPMYIGFSVLDISKTCMYDFHYNYIKPKYNENVDLLYMDTDSFIYSIRTEDFYNDIKPDLHERFDTSSYPLNNIFQIPLVNKKKIEMFKDECNSEIMTHYWN